MAIFHERELELPNQEFSNRSVSVSTGAWVQAVDSCWGPAFPYFLSTQDENGQGSS